MIYLDNAASTEPTAEVLDALRTAAAELYANPASAHAGGAAAARALAQARGEVAAALDVEPGRAGVHQRRNRGGRPGRAGGGARRPRAPPRRERARAPGGHALRRGAGRRRLGAGRRRARRQRRRQRRRGRRRGAARHRRRRADAGEQRARDAAARSPTSPAGWGPPGDRKRPHLHVDAVQGFGLARLRPRALGADSVAVSAHKLHGPRGAGALWLRPGARVAPLWVGGGQERGLRGGSENLPAMVGFGVAARQARAPCRPASRNASPPSAIASSKRRSARWPPSSRACARRSRGAARAAHRLARLPGPARRAAAARPRGARRTRVGRFGLRVAHRRAQPDVEGDRRRRPTAVLRFSFSRLTRRRRRHGRGRAPRRRARAGRPRRSRQSVALTSGG